MWQCAAIVGRLGSDELAAIGLTADWFYVLLLIRIAREIEPLRARLIQAEQSGFTEMTRDEIRTEIREELRRNGEPQD